MAEDPNRYETTKLLVEILELANGIQGLGYENNPRVRRRDTPGHRLNLAVFRATEIKKAIGKINSLRPSFMEFVNSLGEDDDEAEDAVDAAIGAAEWTE